MLNALFIPNICKNFLKIESSERSSAGMWSPACPIRVNSPRVFSTTVLPPVLGPVMTRVSNRSPSSRSLATAFFGSSRGCLAPRRWRYLSDSLGSVHSSFSDSLAGQRWTSSQISSW